MHKARCLVREVTPTHAVRALRSASRDSALSKEAGSGNQALLRRLSRSNPHLQRKLQIGTVNDPLEAEADRVADHVMRMPAALPGAVSSGTESLHRKCAACEDEAAGAMHTKNDGRNSVTGEAPPIIHDVLQEPGRPLDPASRAFFEPRFGVDLASIRVHYDEAAGRSAQAVNARAYAVGSKIVFAPGSYNPHSSEGRHLLAHELTHTLQQGAPGVVARVVETPPVVGSDAVAAATGCEKYTYKNCKGKACIPADGRGTGYCSWTGVTNGCVCYAADSPRLVKFVEFVLKAALVAIGVYIAAEALIALVACFVSGACEIGILVAALGAAGAALVVKMLGSGGFLSTASTAGEPGPTSNPDGPGRPDPAGPGSAGPTTGQVSPPAMAA